jgi:GT2 family glycosyltransferase
MINYYERSRIDNCGIGLLAVGKGYQIGSGRLVGAENDNAAFVFGASGGAALYRRTMLDQIGLLDEDYFSHTEDTDLSWRAQLAGYRCLYVPDAIVYHMGSVSVSRKGRPLYLIQRNLTWTYLKNMPTLLLVITFPLHFLYVVYWLLRAVKDGEGNVVWHAKVDALKELPKILEKRRAIQSKRRLSICSLLCKSRSIKELEYV